MEWNDVNIRPKEGYGWFAVAVLPKNHSGSGDDEKCDLKGDNSWRSEFGFSKAWFNNGEWYEADPNGNRTNNITRFVTHWGELPEVPELTKTHVHPNSWRFNERTNDKELKKMAEDRFVLHYSDCEEHSYKEGFMDAFKILGLTNKI